MYNADQRISVVIDQQGRSLQFSYNSRGLVDSVTLPDGEMILYEYAIPPTDTTNNPISNLTKVIRQDLTERIYLYEDADEFGSPRFGHLLTGITDENGVRFATYSYDGNARVTSSEHAGGVERISLNYTKRAGESFDWSVTEVTMPLGEIVTYEMEPGPFRKLTGLDDTRGKVTMTYDATTTWRTAKTDREGNQSAYQYDNLHETRRTEAVGTLDERVIETDWDNAINRISERREPGKTTTYTHNSRGQILTRTETDTSTLATRTWTYTFFEPPALGPLLGKVQTINGPRTDVSDSTAYEYYTTDHPGGDYLIGDLKAIVNALAHRTDYLKYDGNGRPLQICDANNILTVLTYHPRGWINTRTSDGNTTSFSYDNVGNLTRVTQPDGSFIDYEYDAAHRLTAIADNFNNRVEYTLDAADNRTAERTYDDIGVLRRQLSRVYDQLSRLDRLIDGNNDQTRYGYDSNGNRINTLDANLNTTHFAYDALDRLVRTIDALLGETLMDYDARDNVVSVTDPLSNVTQYTYDGLDKQTQGDSPDTGVTTYEHDAAGNRTAATDARSIRTDYFYDALNRLTDISYPDSTLDVSFTYDVGTNGKGRLTRMTDAVGSVDYAYDARGNLISETRTIGGTPNVTGYAYNGADRLKQMTYPSGMVIDYTLNAAGRLTAIDKTVDSVTETLVSGIQYEPFGPITTFTYGNGLTYSATFDQDYELDQLQSGTGLDWLLGYDPVGNILTITDQVSSANNQSFVYDDLYRLDTAQGVYGDEDFDYDANGNRTRYQGGFVDDAYTYEPQSNQLATQNGWTFERDAAGNRTGKLDGAGYGQLYSYGDHNRLTETTIRDGLGDTVVGVYEYDGRGQRTIKTANGVSTHFIYGLSGELIGEYTGGSSEEHKEYVYLNGQPLAVSLTQSNNTSLIDAITDNTDAAAVASGDWTSSTSVAGFVGSDYQYKTANSAPAGGILVDNGDAGFSVTGTWPVSSSVAGFAGTNYQYHRANGAPPDGVIIDNEDTNTRSTGTWSASSSVSGYEGSNYSYHAAGVGDNAFTWQLSGITAGDYQLYAKWTSHSNRASNASYNVNHVGGTTPVIVNQRTNGGAWVELGTFTLDASSEIVLSDAGDGYVIADSIFVVPLGAQPNTATWTPVLPVDGNYRVYARWSAHANRASDATYTVHHSTGSSAVLVDQRQSGGEWNLLGTYDLDASSYVSLNDQANGYVIADGLYFVAEGTPANTFTWNLDMGISGEYEVFARWTAHANRASDAVYTIRHVNGSTGVMVDQRYNGGGWYSLGTYTLDGASSVRLTDEADGYVIADAMRVVGTASEVTGGTFFIHTDHLGTPRRVTDDSQTSVWRWDSAPFGDSAPDQDPDGDAKNFTLNLRFPGQYFDAESGLHYNYFRTYDPSIGRYVESDPIGLQGGLNTYAYVGSNVLRYEDRFGLDVWYCQRPLGDYTGVNGSGPPVVNHQYICATQVDGTVRCDSTSNPDDDENPFDFERPIGASSLPERDSLDTGECEVIEEDEDRCFERCVIDQWSEPRPRYAIGPHGTDCQEYSRAIEDQCAAVCR